MKSAQHPTPALLASMLTYEPETGKLFWKERARETFPTDRAWRTWNSQRIGAEAFTCKSSTGYYHSHVLGRHMLAHRVVWALYFGQWPAERVDHINGNPADNRIANLRLVTAAQNAMNAARPSRNKSGVLGVLPGTAPGRWRAQIRHAGRTHHLGTFDTIEEAAAARRAADREFGFHPNHGREKCA